MNKCLCSGDLKFYSGALGYEGYRCLKCGFIWDSTNKEEQKEQENAYKLVLKHTLDHKKYNKLVKQGFIKNE